MRILEQGPRNATVLVTAAETISIASFADTGFEFTDPRYFSIMAVDYDVGAGPVSVAFDATTDDTVLTLTGRDHKCFESFGGIVDSKGAGFTGDIIVTGTGPFTLILTLKKHY